VLVSLIVAAFTALPVVQSTVFAQGRRAVPRGGPRSGGVVVAAYYRPLFLPPFYSPFYDPWWYPSPFGWYPPYGYGYAHAQTASLRLQVSPREAEVFIDGYYAGTVDDFDGAFQRLRLEPGGHELTLYLAGHRTERRNIFLQETGTFRFRHTMEPLAPGEAAEPRPPAPARPPAGRGPGPDAGTPPRQDEAVHGDPSFGAMAIRVQPADAEVLIDGEPWDGPRDDETLVVQVKPGTHHIAVSKEGYRSYTAELAVRAAETAPINISLSRQ
jgi:hypothetical protein